MPRMPRYFAPGLPLHVVQRGNDRSTLFVDRDDFVHFRSLLAQAVSRYDVTVHAYVLMTNHVHMLATPRAATSMPGAMHWLGGVFAQYLNTRYGRTGSRFEGRYRAAIVHHDRYLLTCMRYIELNPVRAGITRDPGDYPWSSFRFNALGQPDDLVTGHPNFLRLGGNAHERRTVYREICREALPQATLDIVRAATHKGWALGDETFVSRISAQCRRAAPQRARRTAGVT